MRSTRKSNVMDHEGRHHWQSGRSIDHDDFIEHQNHKKERVAYDRIRLAQKLVEHYDKDQNLVGKTDLVVENDVVGVQIDDQTEAAFDALSQSLGLHCPDVKKAYDEYMNGYLDCRFGRAKCGPETFEKLKYQRLLATCLSRN